MKILLIGFGKINRLIYKEVKENVVGIIDLKTEDINDRPEIIIDFSHPDFLDKTISYALIYNIPVIIGTTAYDEQKMARIAELSRIVPVFKAENLLKGIQLIKKFLIINKDSLKQYTPTINETHHIKKKDSPSGTAVALSKFFDDVVVYSKRDGNTLGIHEVILEDEFEQIKIIHTTKNRTAFALEAIKIAEWLIKKKIGYYTYEDYSYGI